MFFDVDVLTTCATDYETWLNTEPEGHERLGGSHVRRFRVDKPRDPRTFDRLSREILYGADATLDDQEHWMSAQGPYSSALFEYLDVFGIRYDAVLFFSYLYATTYYGLPLVEDRAILVPLAHDEWPLTFSLWDRFFARPRAYVFGSEEERSVIQRRFARLAIDGPVAGIGISPPENVSAERFREVTGITEPFILYLGRIDPSKGCDALVDDYARFRATSDAWRRMVLVGEKHMEIRSGPEVSVLGPVDERMKWDAIAACDLFVMPSPNESLSIAVLEAWTLGRAVLVNGRSDTLVGQCRRSSGGLWYVNADEFSIALEMLDGETRRRLGQNGSRYVRDNYTWERVDAVYRNVIDTITERTQ